MVFSSLIFLCVFLPVVFGLYCLLRSIRVRNALLVIASLLFYAYGEPVYVFLMIASTVFNYAFGRIVSIQPNSLRRKAVLACAVVGNLSVLVVFKYSDMLVATLNGLMGTAIPLPQITLPIGISFFTFQAMSYVIDVYRGQVDAETNYFHVLLYISFFPQLIAGPIIKYHDIAAQITDRRLEVGEVAQGLRRFCVGLAKKVLIANTMASCADALFAVAPGELNALAAWIAAIAYMMQIYFDFSGYSDMAIGLGRMFGFTFKENFDYPYTSRSVKEFWRRWHISLSTWFKEYLYIPLGGNRRGIPRACLNKVIVFFLCGLWHGANWTFVVWGLLHGAFLLFEMFVPVDKLPRMLGRLYVLLMVCTSFVIFRAETIFQGLSMIGAMFSGWTFTAAQMSIAVEQLTPLFIVTLAVALVASMPVARYIGASLRTARNTHPILYNTMYVISYIASFILLVLCVLSLSGGAYNPFIYFRF